MITILKKNKHEVILGILICIYIVYFTIASFLRYDNFYTGRYDLGNMDQVVWNTINGRIFQSRLSAHADFMLVLISPLYLLWSHPKTLLLTQTIVLALGACFVFLIAKNVLKNKNLALVFGFLFLMNPLMQFANLYDFHAVTFATTLLLASFYFLLVRRYFLLAIFLISSSITKEQVWVIASIFGLPLLFEKSQKIRFLGITITILSLAIFGYLITYAIPQSRGSQHFALSYYSDFGDSPPSVISNVLLNPQKLLPIIFEPSRLDYLYKTLVPLGFTSLISPLTLVFTIPELLISLLSNNSNLRQIYYHYSSTVTPFILISSIFAVKKIVKWFPKIPKPHLAAYLLIFTVFSAYSFGPLPGAKNPNINMFTKPYPNKKIVENFLSTIPEKYSVAATNNIGSHISRRQSLFTIPDGISKADVVLFLLNDGFAQPSLTAQKEMANSLKNDKNYIKIFEKEDFVAFKKANVLL